MPRRGSRAAVGRRRPASLGLTLAKPAQVLRCGVAARLLSGTVMRTMRWMATCSIVGLLLVVASTAVAQPGVGITTTAPPPERLETRPPGYESGRPSDARYSVDGPRVDHSPVFIGPTVKSESSELGFSAWIAPNTPVGGLQPGGGEVNGWAAVGLTLKWGAGLHRPSSGPAIR